MGITWGSSLSTFTPMPPYSPLCSLHRLTPTGPSHLLFNPASSMPLAKRCRLQPRDAAKMPESAWKFLFYLGAWSYSAYLLFGTDYPFFHDPPSVFYELALCALLSHSSPAPTRYHNVGILVLFLHDISDVQLEFTKLNVYFKSRGGSHHRLHALAADLGCLSFSVSWFWFRLYWFPLKVLYATCHCSLRSVPDFPFYFFFNALLLLLTLMKKPLRNGLVKDKRF
eukprot:XP_022263062.1 ceramide synthase 1 [Canis lupus familiaris]